MRCVIFILCLGVPFLAASEVDPEQIHLSYGVQASEMIVTWVTFLPTNDSVVLYGQNDLRSTAHGTATKFVDGGSDKRVLLVHRVIVANLKPDSTYVYICGSNSSWSQVYTFHTKPTGVNWSPRLAVYGDMGVSNAHSLPRLKEDVDKGMYDAILHVGDFAYDMDEDQARKGDEFMRLIEPIAAQVPYMTCPGNHENAYNFSNYVNRFTMVNQEGNVNNHFYSFDLGPARIISFSTEFYFFVQYGISQIEVQRRWLEEQLQIANDPINRSERPWLITMAHRPMYCSSNDNDDCTRQQSIIRNGLEDLFFQYGVDLEIWAHEHNYERLFPVYNGKVLNGSYDHPYTNPLGPVHLVTGSAGCREDHDNFDPKPGPWTAFRNNDYGYTRMTIINSTHLYWEQVSDDQDGKVIDEVMIIKEVHGSNAWNTVL